MILDVDAFEPEITDDIRKAILSAKEAAEECQIAVDVAGCGVAAYPEKEVEKVAAPEKLFPRMKRVIGSFYRKRITSDN